MSMERNIYIFFGMIASGKSYLAHSYAMKHNFSYFNTDRVRKELAGYEPASNCASTLNKGIYSQEYTLKTYGALLDRTGEEISQGEKVVILDGSYASRVERGRVKEFVRKLDARAVFILCKCSEDEVKRRLAQRAIDSEAVSDGNWDIYQAQKKAFEPPDDLAVEELLVIDTEKKIGVLLDILDNSLL